jgi:hypothetical protein
MRSRAAAAQPNAGGPPAFPLPSARIRRQQLQHHRQGLVSRLRTNGVSAPTTLSRTACRERYPRFARPYLDSPIVRSAGAAAVPSYLRRPLLAVTVGLLDMIQILNEQRIRGAVQRNAGAGSEGRKRSDFGKHRRELCGVFAYAYAERDDFRCDVTRCRFTGEVLVKHPADDNLQAHSADPELV